MSRDWYHRDVTSFRSRNLVSRVGHEILESTPRATPSTPTPPTDVAPTDATAPVPASPTSLPNRQPNRALADFVDPNASTRARPGVPVGPIFTLNDPRYLRQNTTETYILLLFDAIYPQKRLLENYNPKGVHNRP